MCADMCGDRNREKSYTSNRSYLNWAPSEEKEKGRKFEPLAERRWPQDETTASTSHHSVNTLLQIFCTILYQAINIVHKLH